MAEQLYAGALGKEALDELLDLLFAETADSSYAMLELVPDKYLDENEKATGLQLISYKKFDKNIFWSKGRVFNTTGELNWHIRNKVINTVYSGAPKDFLDSYLDKKYSDLNQEELESYYLWGELIKENAEKKRFLESQIPKIFSYPVSGTDTKRCKINVVSYEHPDHPVFHYFRLHSIEEVTF